MMPNLSQKNFKVIIRARPISPKEKQQIDSYEQSISRKMRNSSGKIYKLSPSAYAFYAKYYNFSIHEVMTIKKMENTIFLADPQYKNIERKMKAFTYSNVYSAEDHNRKIFNENLKADVSSVMQGFNCTILAYGITGSGKTYTVFGPNKQKQPQNSGISYQAFDYLLKQKQKLEQQNCCVDFKLSFIEIYNENVRDLLAFQNNKYLNIVEDGKGNTSITDVTEVPVYKIQDINTYINLGTSKRAFASTNANQYSSRSHAILQLNVQIQKKDIERTFAKLFIIDLAGSEKIQMLNSSKKMQQGANINKSLLALGNCINTLAQNSRKSIVTHIPYRDSKLTRMLKDSLGGNTKTIMIACISPNPFLIEETTTTLNYAMRAQGIQKKLMRNSQEQNNQYVCIKCKKTSTYCSQKQNILTSDKIHLLQQVYEDIIENAREKERINNFMGKAGNQLDWLQIQERNQKQKSSLKQIFFSLLTNIDAYHHEQRHPLRQKSIERNELTHYKQKLNKTAQKFDKFSQNNSSQYHQSKQSNLSGSKSRRRRSHNKFEVIRKSDGEIKQPFIY